jgi:hypothetical protein
VEFDDGAVQRRGDLGLQRGIRAQQGGDLGRRHPKRRDPVAGAAGQVA